MNTTPTKRKNNHIITLMLLMLLNTIGFSIIFPIIPTLFTDTSSEYYFLANSIFENYGFFIQGLVLMIYAVFVFLSAPVLGELSDYYDRKKILNICLFGSAIGYFLFAYSVLTLNIWLLILSRIIDGITGGNISIMQASMGDISNKEDLQKNISKMQAMLGIGFVFGPLLGGILSSSDIYYLFNASTPLIFAGVVSLISIYISNIYLIENKNKSLDKDNYDDEYHNKNRFSIKKLHPFNSIKIIINGFKMKEIRLFLLTLLLFWIGFAMYTNFSNNFLAIRFDFTERDIGYYFAFTGILMSICQLVLVPRINKRFNSKNILKLTYPIFGIFFIIYAAYIHNLNILLYIYLPLFVLLISLNIVNTNIEIMSHTGEENKGKIFGITSALNSIGQAIAPLIGGIIATIFYYDSPFYLSAIIVFIASILLWKAM